MARKKPRYNSHEREGLAIEFMKIHGPKKTLGKRQAREKHRKPSVIIGDDVAESHAICELKFLLETIR